MHPLQHHFHHTRNYYSVIRIYIIHTRTHPSSVRKMTILSSCAYFIHLQYPCPRICPIYPSVTSLSPDHHVSKINYFLIITLASTPSPISSSPCTFSYAPQSLSLDNAPVKLRFYTILPSHSDRKLQFCHRKHHNCDVLINYALPMHHTHQLQHIIHDAIPVHCTFQHVILLLYVFNDAHVAHNVSNIEGNKQWKVCTSHGV